ncbi:MAG TPA: DUF1634 domain-containing protein [Gemmatimonadaceae bacterium]|nr:DUF1634 domain-containing protein [Gemmatimonadaceae bacterium]
MTGPRRDPTYMVVRDARDERVEQMVGRLLRLGVLFAALVVAIGGALLLVQYGHSPANFHDFAAAGRGLRSVGAILTGVSHGDSRAIAQLGLVLLILTPVARVALTLGAFILQRDRLYILTTSIVLALLLYGLVWGRA